MTDDGVVLHNLAVTSLVPIGVGAGEVFAGTVLADDIHTWLAGTPAASAAPGLSAPVSANFETNFETMSQRSGKSVTFQLAQQMERMWDMGTNSPSPTRTFFQDPSRQKARIC